MEEIERELDGRLTILSVSPEGGEVHYLARVSETWELEEAEGTRFYPEFEHPGLHEHRTHPVEYHGGWGHAVDVLGTATSITAVASMVKTFLLRNKGRKVVISWKGGERTGLEVTGDVSVDDIEKLLRAAPETRPVDDAE